MNKIGIMQGRLSPPTLGRIQSFPAATWQQEFFLAHKAGLDCIEWVYEEETAARNPLGTITGIKEIRALAIESGVCVPSICADYFMTRRLVARDGAPTKEAVEHLEWLIGQGQELGIRHIVLPFVDSSSLKSGPEIEGLLLILKRASPAASRYGAELHLETDFAPETLAKILAKCPPAVRANYDIGNSAALGHNPQIELEAIGKRLGSVHIKDRRLGGGTVPLGFGNADFSTCFRVFNLIGYHGSFILQAARVEGLSEIDLAVQNREFVERHLAIGKSDGTRTKP